ncbi:MAG: two-component system, OmpR family, sensor histidine kinase ChvG [Sphingomonadales bacterium]|jgi:two-component system sensor histidine kinase ChvG|nr:two-component system, OmpR family, sensor histidine kinase ChvG [Sphingomonadales bacterium]
MLLHRILAVNVFAVAILAGSIFYLDGFRRRLTDQAMINARTEALMVADALALAERRERPALLSRLGAHSRTRLRVFGADGAVVYDSWIGARPTYDLRDPAQQGWRKDFALKLDRMFTALVGSHRPPPLAFPESARLDAWPEALRALGGQRTETMLREAPEGTPFISAAAPVAGQQQVLLLTRNARLVRRVVREERTTLGIILLFTLVLSGLLSLFLARTIALPLRRLARAAHRVRLGRAREVRVPRLPARRDEIGLLARALSDMSQALRNRIDNTEAFAADVTHELKNPLASLRSAVDSLDRVDDPALRRQLLDVLRHDVVRLDRLIVDIAEVSRLDAELSRARFEPVDLGGLIEGMIDGWEKRAAERDVRIAFARPRVGTAVIAGDEGRLARAIDNIVDNAISFSPEGGLVEIRAARVDSEVRVSVEDDGPGVPEAARAEIFGRFHSLRPESEEFGRHSGLGLAIAKATVEGHDGTIRVEERGDGRAGARFVLRFPDPRP